MDITLVLPWKPTITLGFTSLTTHDRTPKLLGVLRMRAVVVSSKFVKATESFPSAFGFGTVVQ